MQLLNIIYSLSSTTFCLDISFLHLVVSGMFSHCVQINKTVCILVISKRFASSLPQMPFVLFTLSFSVNEKMTSFLFNSIDSMVWSYLTTFHFPWWTTKTTGL
jgi:hypothetical protein